MNSGTQAAKDAGNMVDLDSDPTKLLAVVEVGKQLLITRGALTTFSLANDVAKYFVIIPAVFAASMPGIGLLNLMQLPDPQLAVISARVDAGEVKPVVDRRFAFDDALAAFDYLEAGHARGKVVLELTGA